MRCGACKILHVTISTALVVATGRAQTSEQARSVVRQARHAYEVDSARALDAQFAIARVMDAVNAHLGWRCIGSIIVKQQRFEAPDAPKRIRAIDKAGESKVRDSVEAVNDEALRQALFRLGVMVKTKTLDEDDA